MNAVELRRVTLARGERVVLTDIDATIAAGEFIGILGPNGSGKTTLLQAILGLVKPAAGQIAVLGQPARRGVVPIGYLPQRRAALGDLTMLGYDYVASAVRGERWGLPLLTAVDRDNVDRTLELVEGAALARRHLSQLSGGEVQRLLLAKALLGRPKLLLLDEPLMSLDLNFQAGVVALVKRIQKSLGLTVLFTAHEINPLLGAMDRVFYLAYGQAALGAVDEIITSQVLSKLYRTPIEVLQVNGRIIVVSAQGEMNVHAHHHDL